MATANKYGYVLCKLMVVDGAVAAAKNSAKLRERRFINSSRVNFLDDPR